MPGTLINSRQAAHGAGQQTERLEHAADVVRQPRCHADELRSCTEQGARPVGVERLHVHRPIPPRAHDLRQSLRVVLIGLATTQIAVSFCDTSKPTNRANRQIGSSNRLPWCEPPGDSARIAASWMTYAPAAITRCPHMDRRAKAGSQ